MDQKDNDQYQKQRKGNPLLQPVIWFISLLIASVVGVLVAQALDSKPEIEGAVTPFNICPGQSVTLQWNVTNVSSVIIDGYDLHPAAGSRNFEIDETTVLTIRTRWSILGVQIRPIHADFQVTVDSCTPANDTSSEAGDDLEPPVQARNTPVPTPIICPEFSAGIRLTVGGRGYVSDNESNSIRTYAASLDVIGEIPPGRSFEVIAGPICTVVEEGGIAWWQINYNGTIGWTAEGRGHVHWLAPLP